ncbi:hypothetical protein G7046_g7769 [Stylonectria norvegica]|nr:hypothetical protein G7046_g7769 [Stylonectria norvegica]
MDQRLRPWQRKALKKGRTPLPEGPGQRPWKSNGTRSNITKSNRNESKGPKSKGTKSNGTKDDISRNRLGELLSRQPRGSHYNAWSTKDLELLCALKAENLPWKDIFLHFPQRTPDAVARAWSSYRHKVVATPSFEKLRASIAATQGDQRDAESDADEC